ncbi:MAG TPA: peptide ABC transporter substrate-binding protein [Candidatus Dormibacteraeota bacterium]|nr:peptide ABC transporter substrate-binding protein [Candidatus Dormibacteraeota bacterium]
MARLGAALAALLVLSACSGAGALGPLSRTGPVQGGQVVEAVAGPAGPLNPLFEQGVNEKEIDSLVYQGLTTINQRQQVTGLLAKGWTLSQDGLTYTFDLRAGVRWADGQPFNADDVMFTFQVLQSDQYTQATQQYWKDVKVERGGDLQVKFTLKAPSASFPLALRQGILPRHVFQNMAIADMTRSPRSGAKAIGTGPFKVGSISGDRHVVTLDRNPYANPMPNLDHFVFRSYPSLGDAMDAVSRGEADTVGDLLPQGVAALAKHPDLNVMQIRTFNFAAVLFNLTPDLSAYFNPPAVRQALNQAVDRNRIVRDVLEGHADVASGPIPPTDWAYAKQPVEKYKYDPATAAKTLQAAGWTMNLQTGVLNKGGRDFQVHLVTADAYPARPVAESVRDQLRLIGVQVIIDPVPASVLVSKYLLGKQYQLALASFENGPDPDQSSLWHSGATADSLNFTSADRLPKQALIDKDLEDGVANPDLAARRTAYADFQSLMADAAPAIFLYEPHYTYVVSRRVRGVHTNSVIEPIDRFQYVTDWYATTQDG